LSKIPRVKFRLVIFQILASVLAYGQDNVIYDQQSSTDETAFPYGAGATLQQVPAPYGQSFTPSFSAVDFIRLNLNDKDPNIGSGAILFVNLRANAINGPVLAATLSLALTNGFTGVVNFFFSNSVPLTPNTTYFFEPVVESGEEWNAIVAEYNYPGGTGYSGGFPSSGSDFWFREGIVPEPSSTLLVLLGSGLFILRRQKIPFVSSTR
jgi:PEP-CTERM motif